MNRFSLALSLLFALTLSACSNISEVPANEPESALETQAGGKRIILDTDFGYDADDVGALALLHGLANKGKARIVGVNSSVLDPYSPGAIDAINTYYGRSNIPVGQNKKGKKRLRTAAPYWGNYGRYNKALDQNFPNNLSSKNTPSATSNYKRVLKRQPNKSVTVVVTGFAENIEELLKSSGGRNLVKQKVREIIIMGGPNSSDFNLNNGPAKSSRAASYVIKHSPVPIVFQPGAVCGSVKTGAKLKYRVKGKKNPVYDAYRRFFKSKRPKDRSSWDQCAVLRGVLGTSSNFKTSKGSIRMKGKQSYRVGSSRDRIDSRKASSSKLRRTVGDLMNSSPR